MDLTELRRKADLLGVPWTYNMDNDKLKQAITNAEKRVKEEKAMDGQEVKSDGSEPKCFGLFWAGIPGSDGDLCRECGVGDRCLDLFVKETLPKGEGSKGLDADPKDVSYDLGLGSPAAIVAARKYRADKYPGLVDTMRLLPIEEVKSEESPSIEEVESKEPPPIEEVKSKEPPLIEEVKSEEPIAALTKKKKKKIPPKKKASVQKDFEVKEHPSKAVSSVKSVEGAAKVGKKRKKKKSAQTAGAQAERVMDPWGKHTFYQRWARERERNPLIKKVKIGQVLKMIWPKKSGKVHAAKCCKGYWKVTPYGKDPIEAPTLYKSGVAVTGQSNKWSGPRLWGLK